MAADITVLVTLFAIASSPPCSTALRSLPVISVVRVSADFGALTTHNKRGIHVSRASVRVSEQGKCEVATAVDDEETAH